MRLLLVLVALVLVSAVMADKNQARYRHKNNRKWDAFKKSHMRHHQRNLIRNDDEEEKRFVQFEAQDNLIEENNAKYANGESTFEMEHNALSILSADEMKEYAGVLPSPARNETHLSKRAAQAEYWTRKSNPADLPKRFDWRDVGWTQPIRNQGGCGSCWAFSSASVMEAQIWMATGEMVDLSEQYLLDCDTGSNRCTGGWPHSAVKYAMDYGIPKENLNSYTQYRGVYQGCKGQLSADQKTHPISNLYWVQPSYQAGVAKAEQDTMDMLVNNGPVMTVIWINDNFKSYKQGIFKNDASEANMGGNHAVTIVGYDEDANGKYWIIRNSWANWWGDNGMFKMPRNAVNYGGCLYDQNYSPYAQTKSGFTRIGPKNPAPTISTTQRTTTTSDPCPSSTPCAEWADRCLVYDSANQRCAENEHYCKSCKGGQVPTKGGQITAAPERREFDNCVVGSHCSQWASNAQCLACAWNYQGSSTDSNGCQYQGSHCTKWTGCLACVWDQ